MNPLLAALLVLALFGSALALALYPVVVESFRRAGETADALGVPRSPRHRAP